MRDPTPEGTNSEKFISDSSASPSSSSSSDNEEEDEEEEFVIMINSDTEGQGEEATSHEVDGEEEIWTE